MSERNAAAFNEVAALLRRRSGSDTRRRRSTRIVALAELPPRARILEIGCGTGQITLPLAARGYAITALEPGKRSPRWPRGSAVRTRGSRSSPTSFEAPALQAEAFDLVLAAQAFTGSSPPPAAARAAAALRPGGGIALVWHLDVSQSTAFWQATLPIYNACFRPGSRRSTAIGQGAGTSRCCASPPGSTSARSAGLLGSSRPARAERTSFFQAIADTIERTGGTVRRRYDTVLIAARKR